MRTAGAGFLNGLPRAMVKLVAVDVWSHVTVAGYDSTLTKAKFYFVKMGGNTDIFVP